MKNMKNPFLTIFFLTLSTLCFASTPLNLKVMTYNLRFGELASMEQLGEFIKSKNPDIVFLQEVDVFTQRENAKHQNGKNFIAELGYYTNMLSVYSKSIDYKGGYYGLGILSKYPFESMQRYKLPIVEGHEQRCLLVGKVEVKENYTLTVACTHLDLLAKTREIQVKEINRILKDSTGPIVIGGDFNALPNSVEIKDGMANWLSVSNKDYTSPAKSPANKIDYLFCLPKSKCKMIDSEAVKTQLSDHLPVISLLELTMD